MVTVIDWKDKFWLYLIAFIIIISVLGSVASVLGSVVKEAPGISATLFVIFIAAYLYRQKVKKEVAERDRIALEENAQKTLDLFNSLKARIITTSSIDCKEQHSVCGFVSGQGNIEELALLNLLSNADKLGANMIIGFSVSRNDNFYMSGTAIRVEKQCLD